MPPISMLIKPASGLCNMHCRYCFYCDVMHNRKQAHFGVMERGTLEAVIKKSLSSADSYCTFGFQGGEPTLAGLDYFAYAIELQKKYNLNNVEIHNTLQTNGWNVTEDWAKFFADNDFLIGLSIDGIKRTHEANRFSAAGEPTFERVMQTAALFDRFKVEYNILTVINSRTAREIKRIYVFYKKNGFRYLQFIPCLDPLGEKPGEHDFSLAPEMYGEFLCELFDLWYADLLEDRQPFIRMFENYVAILVGQVSESCDMRGVCGNQYVVEADGSVYPCDFYVLDEYRLGSLRTDDFADLSKNAAHFIEASRKLPEECKICPYYAVCRGGCRRNRLFADNGTVSNYFCPAYKQFFSHTLDRLNGIAEVIRRTTL